MLSAPGSTFLFFRDLFSVCVGGGAQAHAHLPVQARVVVLRHLPQLMPHPTF